MPQNTKLRQPSSGVFRWWMVPLCLLACWLAWWGTTTWLSPKPAWSVTLPNNRHYIPIKESPDQELLLCTDMVIAPNSRRGETLGMTLLDSTTGKVLHTISVKDGEIFAGLGSSEFPQFLGDTLAWLKFYPQSNGIFTYRLHRWHYRENRISTSAQTWSGFHAHAHWPDKSNIVVFQYKIPQSIYQLGYFDNPYYTIAVRTLESSAHLPQFHWYESWELPTGTETEPRFLARWALPYRGWESLHITQDGKWAIFPEPVGNDFQATQRAKASGKGHFAGAELFDMYRSKYKEVLIYNTRTGKVQHRYSDQAAYHGVSQSRQNYFVMQTYYPDPDSKATLAELNAATVNDNKYTRLFFSGRYTLSHRRAWHHQTPAFSCSDTGSTG